MDEILRTLSGPQIVGLTAVVLGISAVFIITLAGMYTTHATRVKEVEAETQLKRDLVAAGFSPEEIERVVRATGSGGKRPEGSSAHPSGGRHRC